MLKVLSIDDMEPIRQWRNESLDILRTPFMLTAEQQADWYKREICDRSSRSRFWGIWELDADSIVSELVLVGYGGIENIQWENRIGEISLLINPECRGKGYGWTAAQDILDAAFNQMNLHTVYAECYGSNKAVAFWDRVYKDGYKTMLPNRKYLWGEYYPSVYYSMSK